MRLGTFPPGTRGFDCNEPLTSSTAKRFRDHGYKFVVRYVRREDRHDYDLTASEVSVILQNVLGLAVVQHVAKPGWHPTGVKGGSYGAIAAEEARVAGVLRGAQIFCDLEGVGAGTDPQDVTQFCNAWYDAVKLAGYDPGLYIGYEPGLTGDELYYWLKFRRYWAGYNLNLDLFPAVRGVCMRQYPYPREVNRVSGVPFQYDENVVQRDHFNNLPTFVLPGDPG